MTTEFAICSGCGQIRALADLRGKGCRFSPCNRPNLAKAPLPAGFRVQPMVKPPEDAVTKVLREMRSK